MNFTHEGLSLWYGTPDAPAPLDEMASRDDVSLTIAVQPPSPMNSVEVRFRVDGGLERTEPAWELRTDYARGVQYFTLKFPPFPSGNVVEYCPTLTCGGRRLPEATVTGFPSRFLLPAKPRPLSKPAPVVSAVADGQRFTPALTFLCAVSIRFDQPDFIGETPEGVRVDYYAVDGTVVGPRLKGRVVPRSADHLFIRPDGIAVMRVRAVIRTDDGAMLEVEYNGNIELGEDGYKRACRREFPASPPLVICPRVLTGHPKYTWLNRLQCLAVGRVRLSEALLEYDVFTATALLHPPGTRG